MTTPAQRAAEALCGALPGLDQYETHIAAIIAREFSATEEALKAAKEALELLENARMDVSETALIIGCEKAAKAQKAVWNSISKINALHQP